MIRNQIPGLFFLMLLLFFSCSRNSKTPDIPVEIIQADTMIQMLADIHLAEAEVQAFVKNDSAGISKTPAYYRYIFDKYHTSAIRFKKSFDFYVKHPALMDETYAAILIELSKRQAGHEK